MESIDVIVVKGHQVASGTSISSPYPAGTIAMQKPYFNALGLDLSECFDGTLNLQLAATKFTILHADFCFKQVKWVDGYNAETFSFVECQLEYNHKRYSAWIYYPHPETKTQHFQQANLVEILAPKIPGIAYGENLKLHYNASKVRIDA